jgi:hypothetical protein
MLRGQPGESAALARDVLAFGPQPDEHDPAARETLGPGGFDDAFRHGAGLGRAEGADLARRAVTG